jgi:alkylhydroperoxidase family enzyme
VKKEMTAFLEAGFSQEQVLEVVMAVSMKTLSNYANHLIDTPLDEALESVRWSAESD